MKTSFGLKLSWITALVAATVMAGCACIRAADQPIRVLIFSGQNNHDWKTTTPKLKAILADSERFMVDVTDHPEQSTAENFANYDLLLSDWNAWGDAKVKELAGRHARSVSRFHPQRQRLYLHPRRQFHVL